MTPSQLAQDVLALAEKATLDEMGALSQAVFWVEKSTEPNKQWMGKTYLEVQGKLQSLRTSALKLAAIVFEMERALCIGVEHGHEGAAIEAMRDALAACDLIAKEQT